MSMRLPRVRAIQVALTVVTLQAVGILGRAHQERCGDQSEKDQEDSHRSLLASEVNTAEEGAAASARLCQTAPHLGQRLCRMSRDQCKLKFYRHLQARPEGGVQGRIRTCTGVAPQGILSPLRLPISPPRLG